MGGLDTNTFKLLLDHGLSVLILVGGWFLLRGVVSGFRDDLKETRADFKSNLDRLASAHETAIQRIVDKLSGELQSIANGITALRIERRDPTGEIETGARRRKPTLPT